MRLANRFSAATAAASNSPLQGQSKPPAEPVVMIQCSVFSVQLRTHCGTIAF